MCKSIGEIEFEGIKGELIIHRDGSFGITIAIKENAVKIDEINYPDSIRFEEVRFSVSQSEEGITRKIAHFLGRVEKGNDQEYYEHKDHIYSEKEYDNLFLLEG